MAQSFSIPAFKFDPTKIAPGATSTPARLTREQKAEFVKMGIMDPKTGRFITPSPTPTSTPTSEPTSAPTGQTTTTVPTEGITSAASNVGAVAQKAFEFTPTADTEDITRVGKSLETFGPEVGTERAAFEDLIKGLQTPGQIPPELLEQVTEQARLSAAARGLAGSGIGLREEVKGIAGLGAELEQKRIGQLTEAIRSSGQLGVEAGGLQLGGLKGAAEAFGTAGGQKLTAQDQELKAIGLAQQGFESAGQLLATKSGLELQAEGVALQERLGMAAFAPEDFRAKALGYVAFTPDQLQEMADQGDSMAQQFLADPTIRDTVLAWSTSEGEV